MSFGVAAMRRGPSAEAPCPCGSGAAYGGCCAPILRGAPAASAEALMRSRYTAFALGDARHLLATWHPRTRPPSLELDAAVVWTRLEIVSTAQGRSDDAAGIVEFRAHWRAGRERGIQHERSAFVRLRGRWHYVDAEPD